MGMTYNGTQLVWDGVGSWNASSGLPDYQNSLNQDLSDKGPIPEGTYRVPLKLGKSATVTSYKRDRGGNVTTAVLDTRSEIESLQCVRSPLDRSSVLLFNQWGSNRVRITKIKIKRAKAAHRDGFYLHDSTKGFSHGCIELDTAFFKALRDYATAKSKKEGHVTLIVDYGPDAMRKGISTYGNTKKTGEVLVQCN